MNKTVNKYQQFNLFYIDKAKQKNVFRYKNIAKYFCSIK